MDFSALYAQQAPETEAVLDAVPDGDLVRARIIDDRPYREVAAAHDLTEPATRKRVSRALARLRKDLS